MSQPVQALEPGLRPCLKPTTPARAIFSKIVIFCTQEIFCHKIGHFGFSALVKILGLLEH